MKTNGIYLLTRAEKRQVDQLRLDELSNSNGFRADPKVLRWNQSDDKAIVIGAYHNGKLVSTLRGDHISSNKELSQKIDYDFLDKYLEFPVLNLGKAATAKKFKGKGLFNYLQLVMLQHFSRDSHFSTATLISESYHSSGMIEQGYKFIVNEKGWRRYGYKSELPVIAGFLDLDINRSSAINKLSIKTKELQQLFPVKLDTQYEHNNISIAI